MPSTVNGIGTGYWGRGNVTVREDFCTSCHRFVQLKSYDTTRSFVILFLPLVPLGRKRVIDQCPVCTRHRIISMRDWRQARAHLLDELLPAWRRQKGDIAAAKDVIRAAALFQVEEAFTEVARELRGVATGDNELHALLAAAFEYFNRLPEAEAEHRAAYAQQPDGANRGALVLNLLRQGRPDDAWPLLEEALTQRDESSVWFLQAAAESYQSLGRHDNALYVIEQTLAAFPLQARNKHWARLRKSSEKNYHTGKSLKGTTLRAQSGVDLGGNRVVSRLGRMIIPAAVLFAVGYYLWYAHALGQNREVHIVNGLPVAYTVEVAGQPVSLPPLGRRPIKIAEGDVHVRALSDSPNIPEQQCRITSGFFTRPFSDRAYVINPDRAALVLWEEAEYAINPDPNAVNEVNVHAGKLLHEFQDIDFPFLPFPQSLELSGDKPQKRTRIDHLRDISPATTFVYLKDNVGSDQALAYLAAQPLREPDDELICVTATATLDKDSVLKAIQPLLDDRPVRIEAHRTFQEIMEMRPDYDLEAEYRRRLAEHPADPTLQYLLSRVVSDRDEAVRLLEQAASADPPLSRVESGIAFEHMVNARFAEAVDHLHKAQELAPKCGMLYEMEMYTLAYGDDVDAMDSRLSQVGGALPFAQMAINHQVYALGRLHRVDEGLRQIEAWIQDLSPGDAGDEPQAIAGRLRGTLHYASDQLDLAAEALQGADQPMTRFMAATIRGEWQTAAAALDEYTDDPAQWHLLIALGARGAHDAALADALMQKALMHLRAGNSEHRQVAAWLAGETPLDVSAALRLPVYPHQKSILLLALGMRFPEHRESLFALARKLNTRHDFPSQTLNSLLDGPAAGES